MGLNWHAWYAEATAGVSQLLHEETVPSELYSRLNRWLHMVQSRDQKEVVAYGRCSKRIRSLLSEVEELASSDHLLAQKARFEP